jgi:hypothetical protein
MNVEQLEKRLKIYDGKTPIYVKPWGEKTLHAIRFFNQKYDKNGKPYIEIIAEDDISMEED